MNLCEKATIPSCLMYGLCCLVIHCFTSNPRKSSENSNFFIFAEQGQQEGCND